MRNRSDVLDNSHFKTRGLQSPNSCFSPRTRSLYANFYFSHPHIQCFFCCGFCSQLRGERRAFPGTLKSLFPGRSPRNRTTVLISYGHNRIVKRGFDMCHAFFYDTLFLSPYPFLPSGQVLSSLLEFYFLRRTPTVFFGPLRVRAFV